MVQAIFKNNFDAIFINSNINNANFISSVIEIRNINPIIPIIIITEQVSEEERFQAVEVGCSYFINKPLTQENIDQALKYVYKDLK